MWCRCFAYLMQVSLFLCLFPKIFAPKLFYYPFPATVFMSFVYCTFCRWDKNLLYFFIFNTFWHYRENGVLKPLSAQLQSWRVTFYLLHPELGLIPTLASLLKDLDNAVKQPFTLLTQLRHMIFIWKIIGLFHYSWK